MSVHGGGVSAQGGCVYPSMQWGRHPPWADTPVPWADTPAQCMLGYTPSPAQCMLGYTHTPAQYMLGYPPPHKHSACWDTVNKRVVRIPLECILVELSHYTYQVFSHTKPAFSPFESGVLASAFT